MNSILTGSIFYKFLNFKRILPNVLKIVQDKIFQLLDNTFRNERSIGLDKLGEIKIQMLVTEKSSYFYTRFPQAVENLIQREVMNLAIDGGSHPGWKWGEKNLWTQVEKEWSGKLTYDLLVTLKYLKLADFDKELN